MNIKVNSERSAAVNQDTFWLPIDEVPPPVGVKLLLINERNGVAVLGTYHQKHQWTHWQGLPKFKQPGDEPQVERTPSDRRGLAGWIKSDGRLVWAKRPDAGAMLYTRPLPERDPPTKERIREILIAKGFTIKDGEPDLKPYVYNAVYAVLEAAAVQQPKREDVLLEVIQRLNQNPYSLTKSECIDLISAMRDEATRGAA